MIRIIPKTNNMNMRGISQLFLGGKSLNSFKIKTPHIAATSVAPWPKPYAIAGPACSEAKIFNDIPIPQMIPPNKPIRWSFGEPILK